MKSSRKSTVLTANMPYYSRPIRRIQDFDESKDHCLTLKNTPYPHQQYAVCNTLVNEDEQAGFTQYAVSIKNIQRIRAYTSLDTTKDSRPNTPYPGSSIRRIQDIEGEDSGRYQTWSLLQESPIRRIPHRWIRRIEPTIRPYI
ncbi:hypothetical protein Tco_0036741 [Tanacetum coccineum]